MEECEVGVKWDRIDTNIFASSQSGATTPGL